MNRPRPVEVARTFSYNAGETLAGRGRPSAGGDDLPPGRDALLGSTSSGYDRLEC